MYSEKLISQNNFKDHVEQKIEHLKYKYERYDRNNLVLTSLIKLMKKLLSQFKKWPIMIVLLENYLRVYSCFKINTKK